MNTITVESDFTWLMDKINKAIDDSLRKAQRTIAEMSEEEVLAFRLRLRGKFGYDNQAWLAED